MLIFEEYEISLLPWLDSTTLRNIEHLILQFPVEHRKMQALE